MNKSKVIVIFLVIILITGAIVFPAPVSAANEYDVYFKAESFTWKEFENGERILKESGPIFGAGASAKLENKSLTFKLKGELFGGRADYDGQTQAGTPVKTDADYVGTKIEGDIGWILMISENISVEPYIGPGMRYWVRDLKSTNMAIGVKEKWRMIYGRLGLHGSYDLSEQVTAFMEGGATIPIDNENRVDYYDKTVEPGKKTSYFAEAGVKWRMVRTVFYYEGLRFSRSELVPIGGGSAIFQPESKSDMFGIKIGWTF